MSIKHFALPALLVAFLCMSAAASAHDGSEGENGRAQWSHQGECHKMQLSEEKRQLLHETMRKSFEKNKELFHQVHKLHEQLRSVLKADTFDRQAFLSINAQIEKLHDRIHKTRVEAFASIASQFTPEERVMLMRHHHHHHQHAGGWHHQGSDDRHHSMNDGHASHQQDDQDYPPYPGR